MTEQIARLYAFAAMLAVFFLTWAAVAAHPWGAPSPPDPQLAALAVREQRVRAETVQVKKVVDRRWAVYRAALKRRNTANARIAAAERQAAARRQAVAQPSYAAGASVASAPQVRVVMLPPLTVTRTS